MYSVTAYYLGKSIIELPFILLFPAIFVLITYYIIGYNPGVDHFFIMSIINYFYSENLYNISVNNDVSLILW